MQSTNRLHGVFLIAGILCGQKIVVGDVNPTYSDLQALFNGGSAVTLSGLPESAILSAKQVDQDSNVAASRLALRRLGSQARISVVVNSDAADADAVRDLEGCQDWIPTAAEDSATKALVQWNYMPDARPVWYYSAGEQRSFNQGRVSWREASLSGKTVWVGQVDIAEPGFGFPTGVYPYPGPSGFSAAHYERDSYFLADEPESVGPSAALPDCNGLIKPYSWWHMVVNPTGYGALAGTAR